MTETRKVLAAAAALSVLLGQSGVRHAFYGNIFIAVLADCLQSDEIFCIAEGGNTHPFRRVRDALAGSADFTVTPSPLTNRLHTTYRRITPPIEIEILPSGEEGPRLLDGSKVMAIRGIPFLTVSEFIRAKLKAWVIRGADRDAQNILFVLTRYWNRVDINRINEQDMQLFVSRHPAAAEAWVTIRKKYGT